METLKCQCGGVLEPVVLAEYDFTTLAGYPCILHNVSALRCSKEGSVALEGEVCEAALDQLAQKLARGKERLDSRAARYLRKYLGFSQKELAEHLGISRETVARWECEETEISQQHDLLLRMLVLTKSNSELHGELNAVRRAPSQRQAAELDMACMQRIQARRGRRLPRQHIEKAVA